MKDANKKNRSRLIYGKLRPSYDLTDRLAEILANLVQEEPDYAAITSQLAGVSMCAYENGSNSIDDNGDDVGDELERFQDCFLNYDC